MEKRDRVNKVILQSIEEKLLVRVKVSYFTLKTTVEKLKVGVRIRVSNFIIQSTREKIKVKVRVRVSNFII